MRGPADGQACFTGMNSAVVCDEPAGTAEAAAGRAAAAVTDSPVFPAHIAQGEPVRLKNYPIDKFCARRVVCVTPRARSGPVLSAQEGPVSDLKVASPAKTSLQKDAFGVPSVVFFVLSAQAPLTGVVGTAALAVALGNGAGAPAAFIIVGLIISLFAVGFCAIARYIDCHGGFGGIVDAGLGREAGVGSSALAILSYNTVQLAMYALLGVSASAAIVRHGGPDVPWWLISTAATVLVWFLGSRRVEVGARVLAVLVAAEVVLLLAFGFGVLFERGIGAVSLSGSFGAEAVFSGAPGIAIMFAIASMFGFESTIIFSREARDPHRTVPRATYIAVATISIFLAFELLMIVTYYGAADTAAAAGKSLGTDPALFVLGPMIDVLGGWAGDVAEVLLCTSLLAGVLAFHNMITRYLHSMGTSGMLPIDLARTNRSHAPWIASIVQTVVCVVVIAAFAISGAAPLTTLFSWFAGIAVVTLVTLYVISSIAIVRYFQVNQPADASAWSTRIAPTLSIVVTAGLLVLLIANFGSLVVASTGVRALCLGVIPVTFVAGVAAARRARRNGAVPLPL